MNGSEGVLEGGDDVRGATKGGSGLVARLGTGFEVVAGVALVAIMLLTGCDIVGRAFGHPIPGTYEIVSFAGGLVVGLVMPVTSLERGHVFVDLLVDHLPPRGRAVFHASTRLLGVALFLVLGYATIRMGLNLRASGEVTPVLRLPFYPVTFAIAGACLLEALVLVVDLRRGKGEGP